MDPGFSQRGGVGLLGGFGLNYGWLAEGGVYAHHTPPGSATTSYVTTSSAEPRRSHKKGDQSLVASVGGLLRDGVSHQRSHILRGGLDQ